MLKGNFAKHFVNFNSGELSPLLDARIDIDKYNSGCRTLENFIIEPYGLARRRPGMQYISDVAYAANVVCLHEFRFSSTTNYILEFSRLRIRFFSNGGIVTDGVEPIFVFTPYEENEIFDVRPLQINDVMYLFHPSHVPHKLVRNSATSFSISEISWDYPPMLDINATSTTITPSSDTGTITLTASSSIFTAENVGGYYEIGHYREADSVQLDIVANATSGFLRVKGNCTFYTTQTWTGKIEIERSLNDGTTWEVIRSMSSDKDKNYEISIENSEPALIRFVISNWATATSTYTPRAVLEAVDSELYGLVKVTGYTSGTVVTAQVIGRLYGTSATTLWSEGAFSDRRGWPTCGTFFEQRLVMAGTSYRPQTIWFSKTGDFQNFTYGTNDDEAFTYTIGARERASIHWIMAHRYLILGTDANEWAAFTENGGPITPKNVSFKVQSHFGSSGDVVIANDIVAFVQRLGNKVRESRYTIENDGYIGEDLTTLANHVTDGGIRQIAYQQQPLGILWAVTNKGELIGMTNDRAQNVLGWHRHTTDGIIESVATVYGSQTDEVWLVVRRNMAGGVIRSIERFNPTQWLNKEDAFFVDCGLTYSGSATTTISGLTHLNGRTVAILADGCVEPEQVVVGGQITLSFAASKVHVGLPFVSTLEPMKLDVDPSSGVTFGQIKRIYDISMRLYKSIGCTISDGTRENELSFRDSADYMDDSPPLFTGDKSVEFDGDFDAECRIIIKQTEPLPLTILGFIVRYQVTD